MCKSELADIVRLKQSNSPGCHISGDILIPTDSGRQFVCMYTYLGVTTSTTLMMVRVRRAILCRVLV